MRTNDPTPSEKKTGARYRKITAWARRKRGGKNKILFTGNVCAYLTCRLMSDPVSPVSPSLTTFSILDTILFHSLNFPDFSDTLELSDKQLSRMRRAGRPTAGDEPRKLIATRLDDSVKGRK